MATIAFLRKQAATCATLAEQTHDEESRQRCLRLEQTYLHLAETEEQRVDPTPALTGESEREKAGFVKA